MLEKRCKDFINDYLQDDNLIKIKAGHNDNKSNFDVSNQLATETQFQENFGEQKENTQAHHEGNEVNEESSVNMEIKPVDNKNANDLSVDPDVSMNQSMADMPMLQKEKEVQQKEKDEQLQDKVEDRDDDIDEIEKLEEKPEG